MKLGGECKYCNDDFTANIYITNTKKVEEFSKEEP